MTIVFLDARTVGPEPDLSQFNQLAASTDGTFVTYPETAPDQTAERLRDAEVVITNKVRITREVMDACPRLKLICVAATGTNNVDMAAAQERQIPVKNVAGYSTHSVAQVTFTLLLSLLNSPHYYDQYVKSGEYSRETIFTHLGRPFWELAGKRFGIIGLGAIGRQVAQIAVAFGGEVVYFSASGQTYDDVPYQAVSLDELLGTSDVLSVHAPLTDKTNNLLTYAQLSKMKPSALLLGLSRGGMINEADLARALDEGKLAGAGMDVFGQEPPAANHPYLTMTHPERLVLAPHIAWSSLEARQRLMDGVAENIREFLNL
ncbi:2-hydroxyacid dehydrogenase [Fibrella aestuarina BUZ 2]|uniref:2-hydroxyacid dehydrogenase n=1 Tax=Fibrella aestuarina BUZ 2 TaxID=1166018 RepID=I0KG20_9BACT|nr:D-2-hydroxyacid dehydrogenase [Fibrella aestuarina]CCH03073.1 2-hydroxyacid dehydrogenase [Fibrella aestuarina BUZ 2]